MIMRVPVSVVLCLFLIIASASQAFAAKGDGVIDPGEDEIAELARAVQNPIANLISVPIQNNTMFDWGPQGDTLNVLNIQPVFNDNCSVCHGAGGRGPALSEIKALSSADRRDRIRNHPIAGQIPQRLPAIQLSDVIEFFESE